MHLYNEIEIIRKNGERTALCIVVQVKGSAPRKIGAKMIVKEDGRIIGTIGGGNLEKKVIKNAQEQIKKNEPKLFKHDLLHHHNMCCGGTVEIYIEPIQKMNKLFIFGAGHTGNALAKHATEMDFDIYVIDDRAQYLKDLNVNSVNKLNVDYKKVLPTLPFDEKTFIVIMTYEHSYDRDILAYCINQPHAYLGMIGSQRKVELTKKMFEEGKLSSKVALDKVDMPMGININAEGPEEIAISVLAKLIEIKNG